MHRPRHSEEHQQPPEACRGEEGSPLEPGKGVGSCRRPDFGLLVFRAVREVSVVLSHPFGGTLLRPPQETDAGNGNSYTTWTGSSKPTALTSQRPWRRTTGLGRLV